MHVEQGFAQAGQARIGEHRRRQPIVGIFRAGLVERLPNEQAQTPLSQAFRTGIDRREMLLRRLGSMRVDTPIFRMHELQSLGAAARLAETTNPRTAREALLLL